MAFEVEHHAMGTHRLGPHVVGSRVVVRHLLADGRASDILGVCQTWGPDHTVIRTEAGEDVRIPLATIVTGKPVPPRASVRQRVPAREAELHSLALFPGLEIRELGAWLLRSEPEVDGRPRKRANSALAVGDPRLPATEAARTVVDFYAERGRVPLAQVLADSDEEAGLRRLGWVHVPGDSHFQVASLAGALRRCRDAGSPTDLSEDDATHARAATSDGRAGGRAALSGDWLGLHALHTDPAARRQGLARAVLADLLDWGGSLGATTAWVHVEADNSPALGLYQSLGFRTHHSLRYLAAPVPAQPPTGPAAQ